MWNTITPKRDWSYQGVTPARVGTMISLLVTGGSGLLGNAVVRQAVGRFRVLSTYHKNPIAFEGVEFVHADLLNDEDLKTLSLTRPRIIIHCAALTNVDYCESHPDEAYAQNVQASINVARMARDLGSYMIHISTDGVFNGERGSYSEDDSPNPINSYGRSKLDAERRVSEACAHCCIVRTNIFGWNAVARKSMAEWMVGVLRNGEVLSAFKDVIISPILVNDLAEILFELCLREHQGTIHIGSRDSCSKLEFAHIIAEVFEFDQSNIKPISVDEMHLGARRPKNTSLNVLRISSLLEREMPSVLYGIRKMKQLRNSGYARRVGYDRS
jgi:dTDP-4-dehydrorhamnose reductase